MSAAKVMVLGGAGMLSLKMFRWLCRDSENVYAAMKMDTKCGSTNDVGSFNNVWLGQFRCMLVLH